MKLKIGLALMPALAVLLAGCSSLPKELRREIEDADRRLTQAEHQFKTTSDEVRADLASSPDLFRSVSADWTARLASAKTKLGGATFDREELKKLEKQSGKETEVRARQILIDEDRQRQNAIDEANAVQAQASRWIDFQRNLPHYVARMKEEHDGAHTADFASVVKTVEKAEQDWPGKKADLDRRLEALKDSPEKADRAWMDTSAEREAALSGKATGTQVATLIQADEAISTAAHLPDEEQKLVGLSGQLYNAWDKVLEDLDVRHEGASSVYREKLKTVRTHFAEAGDKAPRTETDIRWTDVSPAAYQAVENDLGMAISHKDAGLYDSEALNVAQPAGFAYIAPPSVGSNQYGYWTHNSSGSFWTFLPQYLIMRELFWGNSYRPIVVNEYNSYYSYARTGKTYYGQTSPAAPPKYGSHGTFTQQNYASSRYVQSGGFKNSSFASRTSPAPQAQPYAPAAPRMGNAPSDNSQGKRFGRPAGPTPSGKRFGGGASPPSGKRFGGGGSRRR